MSDSVIDENEAIVKFGKQEWSELVLFNEGKLELNEWKEIPGNHPSVKLAFCK